MKPLEVHGQFDIDIGILRNQSTVFTLVVANIQAEGLLVMDFIRYFGCELYPSAKSLVCQGEQVMCGDVGSVNAARGRCCQLKIRETTVIPPRTRIVLLARRANTKHVGKQS
jgi:hypothetical protein